MRLKDQILRGWSNVFSWRSPRRVLVIESDDWGALRIRDKRTWRALSRLGLDVSHPYDRYDCLETKGDLDAIFNVLTTFRDERGRPPIITFNTVMGNPDFGRILECGFESYHHLDLVRSYERHGGEDLVPALKAAAAENLACAQFHAREHLNVPLWMKDLRDGRAATLAAFEHEYYALTLPFVGGTRQTNYLAAFWVEDAGQLREAHERLTAGLKLFAESFGYVSRTWIPCNYVTPVDLEAAAAAAGVMLLQGQRGQLVPDGSGCTTTTRRWTGKRNNFGQLYGVRNIFFEPFLDPDHDWVSSALSEVDEAFSCHTPAIVSSHRVNYVAGMSTGHRDRNLGMLRALLTGVLARWPDVLFVSSHELAQAMATAYLHRETTDGDRSEDGVIY